MCHQPRKINFTAEYKLHILILQVHRGAVGAEKRFFIHAHSGRINPRFAALGLREQHHSPAGTRCIHGWPNEPVSRGSKDHNVSTTPFRQFANQGQWVGLRRIDVIPQPKTLTYFKTSGIQIGSYYRRTSALGQGCQYDANGALPNHESNFTGFNSQRFNGLHARVDGFYERRLLIGNTVRNLDDTLPDNPVHGANIFCESTAAGFKAGRGANLLVNRALGKDFMTAVVAFAARNMMENHHAIASFEI